MSIDRQAEIFAADMRGRAIAANPDRIANIITRLVRLAAEIPILLIQIPGRVSAGRLLSLDLLRAVQAIGAADGVGLPGIAAAGVVGTAGDGGGQAVLPGLLALGLLGAAGAIAADGEALGALVGHGGKRRDSRARRGILQL